MNREQAGQLDLATQRLLDDARTLTEGDLQEPSLLPGWTRAHVLAHVARGADAMRNQLAGARPGDESAQEAAIEAGARLSAADLLADLADSAMALRALARQRPGGPTDAVLVRRLTEVELHHCDLGTGYGPADWTVAFTELELPEPMRSQRQERLAYPQLVTTPKTPPRPPAPWQPGRPLPGSWIGPTSGRP